MGGTAPFVKRNANILRRQDAKLLFFRVENIEIHKDVAL
jgi:hypothetical protein